MPIAVRDHIDPAGHAGIGCTRRDPLTSGEIAFARSRRAMGASWTAIGRMLGGRHGEDVRGACEGVIETLPETAASALADRLAQLEAAFGLTFVAPAEWRLTAGESRMLGALRARDRCSKQAMLLAFNADPGADEAPAIRIVDVIICKLRKKIEPIGVEIATLWGYGYHIDATNKRRLEALLATEDTVVPTAAADTQQATVATVRPGTIDAALLLLLRMGDATAYTLAPRIGRSAARTSKLLYDLKTKGLCAQTRLGSRAAGAAPWTLTPAGAAIGQRLLEPAGGALAMADRALKKRTGG